MNLTMAFVGHGYRGPFKTCARQISVEVCNAITRQPIELESYLNHLRIQQVL